MLEVEGQKFYPIKDTCYMDIKSNLLESTLHFEVSDFDPIGSYLKLESIVTCYYSEVYYISQLKFKIKNIEIRNNIIYVDCKYETFFLDRLFPTSLNISGTFEEVMNRYNNAAKYLKLKYKIKEDSYLSKYKNNTEDSYLRDKTYREVINTIINDFGVVYRIDTLYDPEYLISTSNSKIIVIGSPELLSYSHTKNSADLITNLTCYGKKNDTTGERISTTLSQSIQGINSTIYGVLDERFTDIENLKQAGQKYLKNHSVKDIFEISLNSGLNDIGDHFSFKNDKNTDYVNEELYVCEQIIYPFAQEKSTDILTNVR